MKEWVKEWTRVPGFSDTEETIYEQKYYRNGGVARITINRPEKLNSITRVGMEEINAFLDDAGKDDSIGVVVITGAGDRAFCAGGDTKWEEAGGLRTSSLVPISLDHAVISCPKPVIAAVKGYAIGGGNHWAYFCDLTIAADNARFGQVGPKMGSPAGDYITSYATRVVGAKKAKEMWMLCEQYSAEEALKMGLVNKVVPLEKMDEAVEEMCLKLLGRSPTCLKIVKASFAYDIMYLQHYKGHFMELIAPHYFGRDRKSVV